MPVNETSKNTGGLKNSGPGREEISFNAGYWKLNNIAASIRLDNICTSKINLDGEIQMRCEISIRLIRFE